MPSYTNPNPYPRLASVNAIRTASQAQTFDRYSLVIAPLSLTDTGVQALKTANPGCKVLAYLPLTFQDLTNYDPVNHWFSGAPGTSGLVVAPQWWLGVAGTGVWLSKSVARQHPEWVVW